MTTYLNEAPPVADWLSEAPAYTPAPRKSRPNWLAIGLGGALAVTFVGATATIGLMASRHGADSDGPPAYQI